MSVLAFLLRTDRRRRPLVLRDSRVELSYEEAVAESDRVVAWIVRRFERARPNRLERVLDDALDGLDAALSQLYAARRPAKLPEKGHHDLVAALRTLASDLLRVPDTLHEGRATRIQLQTAPFLDALESLRAAGIAAPSKPASRKAARVRRAARTPG